MDSVVAVALSHLIALNKHRALIKQGELVFKAELAKMSNEQYLEYAREADAMMLMEQAVGVVVK